MTSSHRGGFPEFSIVIPSFNRSHAISRAVRSALDQTFQDFEILVIDDGSTDDTRDVVCGVSDPRVKYVFQENSGAPAARNKGINLASGRYLAFLDSDDEFLPEHLADALPVLESGVSICTYTQIIVDRGNGIRFLKPPRPLRADESVAEYYMCDRGFVQTSTLIVPEELAKKVRYDERMSTGNDMEFSIRLAQAGGILKMLQRPGAIWYDTGLTDRLSSRDNLEERLRWLERIRPDIPDRAYYGEMGWRIARRIAQRGNKPAALRHYLQALIRGCYRPKLAVSVFLQVLLSPSSYREMADFLAGLGFRP